LLEALWPLLGAGGKLLYCVCSLIPAETDGPIADLLARHPEGRAEELPVAWGLATRHGRQILPGSDAMDGFYYALVGKPGGSA
jgi:16S rRNA (cytosine967-C5)-methyltransferase